MLQSKYQVGLLRKKNLYPKLLQYPRLRTNESYFDHYLLEPAIKTARLRQKSPAL